MHFRSETVGGYRVLAVSGINTISFAIDFRKADTTGLLGFAVERVDPTENERYFIYGMKTFASVLSHPMPQTAVSTFDHPVQSFVWDDFTAKPDRRYDYIFHPIRGRPKNLDRSAPPIPIGVRTEPLYSTLTHDVFFNRGVASSQAYERRFGNKRPDDLKPEARKLEALQWLSRDLDDALFRFIDAARAGDTLLGCFYEFRYLPAAERLKAALDRGVNVQLILDAKNNATTDKKGVVHASFPLAENRKTVADAGLPASAIRLWRAANRNDIQHNKFMVLLRGAQSMPQEVWTGSTNLSEGGIHGQTNVGHWVRDAVVATAFRAYWDLLATDPGAADGDTATVSRARRKAYRDAVMALGPVPETWPSIPRGTTPVFSPRTGGDVLAMYVDTLDSAEVYGGITLAFGIGEDFKRALIDNTSKGPVLFLMLEKRDRPNPRSKKPFVPLTARQNVYEAWGSFLRDPVAQWARETDARKLKLNTHVAYIHSKFLLKDPLGADPIVITGSANFSAASTNSNDENMLLIRGSARVADIYFTEFNRLFNHYYFRSVQEVLSGTRAAEANAAADSTASLFLDETDGWLSKYAPGKLRRKRVEAFLPMAEPQILSL